MIDEYDDDDDDDDDGSMRSIPATVSDCPCALLIVIAKAGRTGNWSRSLSKWEDSEEFAACSSQLSVHSSHLAAAACVSGPCDVKMQVFSLASVSASNVQPPISATYLDLLLQLLLLRWPHAGYRPLPVPQQPRRARGALRVDGRMVGYCYLAAMAKNVVLKVQFSPQWRPLSTLDPAHVRRRHHTNLHAKFRHRTSRRFRVYRANTLRQLFNYYFRLL